MLLHSSLRHATANFRVSGVLKPRNTAAWALIWNAPLAVRERTVERALASLSLYNLFWKVQIYYYYTISAREKEGLIKGMVLKGLSHEILVGCKWF